MHPIVLTCLVLVLLGAGLALTWGHLHVETPPPAECATFVEQVRRALWYLDIVLISGVVSGLLVAGAGGRLAMRLLAVTSGDRAQGRITEANEVVGEITIGGTVGFVVFAGLFAGLVGALTYMLLRKWLPKGQMGALAFGGILLVTLGSRAEPLRSNNPDFDLVSPDWLAVSVFTALTLLYAAVLVAIVARLSRSLPLFRATRRVVFAYSPLLLLIPTVSVGAVVVVVMLAGVAVSTQPAVRQFWAATRLLLVGRIVVAVGVVASLPGFTAAIADII